MSPPPNIVRDCLAFLCIAMAITTNIMQICTKMYDFYVKYLSDNNPESGGGRERSPSRTPSIPHLPQHRGESTPRPGHRSSARPPDVEHKSAPDVVSQILGCSERDAPTARVGGLPGLLRSSAGMVVICITNTAPD